MTIESSPLLPAQPFRFGLKELFVVMTILCVLLGWRFARHRQAAQIVARSSTVLDTIESNVSTAPQGTSFAVPLILRQKSASFLKKTRPDMLEQTDQLGHIASNGTFSTLATRVVHLDIRDRLAENPATDLGSQLRSHYEKGLAAAGLRRAVMTGDGDEKSTAIWQMADHGLHVVIDVDLHTDRNRADVRVIFLHNESLSIW